jgi:hypothetical protein
VTQCTPTRVRLKTNPEIRRSYCTQQGRRNWEEETSPFIRFGIQLYHAFLTAILLWHGQLHHVGDDDVFPMWSLLAAVPSYAKQAREIVACAGIAGRGQGRRD